MIERVVLTALTGLMMVASIRGQTPTCDALERGERELAQKLLTEQYLYDCCDRTIAACLADTPTCRLAVRLADSVCRRVAAGQDETAIVRGLSRRARSMTTPRTFAIDLNPEVAAAVGPDTARVVLVEYACARCPFCARITPRLYEEVTTGRLKERVRFCFKVFPIRSHIYSKETGLGLMAAIALGRFWPFLLHTYARFDEFSIDEQQAWAKAAGMDPAAFDHLVAAPGTVDLLVASKKEGLRNQVDATPAFFINGRRYVGDMDLEEIVDVLLEETERVNGLTFVIDPAQQQQGASDRRAAE
jgi:protein-disulfide isomerase